LKSKIFIRLIGLFVLLLLLQAAAMEFVFIPFFADKILELPPGKTSFLLGHETLYSGLIALAVALSLAVWVAGRISVRLARIVAFAQQLA